MNFTSKSKNIETFNRLDLLISKIRSAFTKLWQAFIESPIFHYFNPKSYIEIEINTFGYVNSNVFSQLVLNDLDQ